MYGKVFVRVCVVSVAVCMVWGEDCSFPCRCPSIHPICPLGTSLILDGCGCCKVCAKQVGDPCSILEPCDQHKGLYCDYSILSDKETGVCMAQEGATCDLGGVIYRSGETFQPSCKHHCICMNGEIGCVPTCANDMQLPSPDCPFPRRIKIPGKCCEDWVCDQKQQADQYQAVMAVYQEVPAFNSETESPQENCIVQTTEWSECSKSCGMGISTRVTNDNEQCQLEKQSRLCMVRPCEGFQERDIKKGKKCVRTPKTTKAMRYELSGCTSTRTYKPKFCGVCTDGRCCTPHTTGTMEVEFRCPEGDKFHRKMMFIRTCSCHHNCPQDNDIFLSTNHRRMFDDYDNDN
ncbi:CCN family member 2b [Erpetoichthys calabaricus]|uniref:CCN family member 3 n=1 Tax=Erpetoichthys calabaricus TaxID=27687 RepID=A0A8C4XDW7_ERPCA|nr:CCN family member 2b [Erpetoichthys calabaricus]